MTVVPLRPDGDDETVLVRRLLGGRGPVAQLATEARDRADAQPRSLEDAALDVVTCWLLDQGAHAQILRIWASKVGRWSRAAAGAGVDADDVAQEVLCRLAVHLPRHREGLALGQWLWRTTYLVLREAERRSWWSRWLDRPLSAMVDPAPSVPARLQRVEREAAVQALLQALDLEERLLLWSAYVDGCSRDALAARFGWPVGTLNRKLTRARAAFRAMAEQRGFPGALP